MAETAIAASVLISFIFYEGLGLLSGGMVSAGYLALFWEQPLRILTTLLLSVLAYLISLAVSRRTILYGRRRFMIVVLLGMVLGWLANSLLAGLSIVPQDLRVIGHIVPGLIANDMHRQGVGRTLFGVVMSCALICLFLMAVRL